MPKGELTSNYDLNGPFVDAHGDLYTEGAAGNLVLWTRMDPGTPIDKGPNALSPTYSGSPGSAEQFLAHRFYNAVTLIAASSQYAQVTSATGLLDFTDTADGGHGGSGPYSDKAFSISLWVKFASVSATQYLFAKRGVETDEKSYYAYVTSAGVLRFELKDDGNGGSVYIDSAAGTISAGTWYHLVFAYNPDAPFASLRKWVGLRIYINGLRLQASGNESGTYNGMEAKYSGPLFIGANSDGPANYFDGQMLEFAVWVEELGADDIVAIYNVTRFGAHKITSGYLNNPTRTILHARDNALGRYPTISRTGDPNFLGKFPVHFNDTDTLVFSASSGAPSEVITYPGLLKYERQLSGSANVSSILPYPNVVGNPFGAQATATLTLLGPPQESNSFDGSGTPNDSLLYLRTSDGSSQYFYAKATGQTVSSGKAFSVGCSGSACDPADDFSAITVANNLKDAILAPYLGDFPAQGGLGGKILVSTEEIAAQGAETLTDGNNLNSSNWTSTSAITTNASGYAEYNAGISTGQLVQAEADLATPIVGSTIYKFTYSIYITTYPTATTNGTLYISTETAAGEVRIPIDDGGAATTYHTFSQFFLSAVSPTDFVIKAKFGQTGDRWRFKNISLKTASSARLDFTQHQLGGGGNEVVYNNLFFFGDPETTDNLCTSEAIWTNFSGGFGGDTSTTGSISLTRPMVAGVSDDLIDMNQNNVASQSLGPFVDSRVYLDPGFLTSSNPDPDFYMTGTATTVVPDFTSKLADKTILTFNFGTTTSTDFFFSTGTIAGSPAGINPSIGYFNVKQSKWDIIGDLSSGSNIDSLNAKTLSSGCLLAFQPPDANIRAGTAPNQVALVGAPISTFGFPFASKFSPTGSQLIKMSDYITHPFLLEKVQLEFSASFPSTYTYEEQKSLSDALRGTACFGPQTFTFFLLNEFPNTSGTLGTGKGTVGNINTNAQGGHLPDIPITTDIPFDISFPYSGSFRELITYGTVGIHPIRAYDSTVDALDESDLPTIFKRDLNLFPGQEAAGDPNGTNAASYSKATSGSYRLRFPVRTPSKITRGMRTSFAKPGTAPAGRDLVAAGATTWPKIWCTWEGTRAGVGLTSGHSYVRNVPGFDPKPGASFEDATISGGPYLMQLPSGTSTVSPYVLLPTDTLVLGFANPRNARRTGGYGYTALGTNAGYRNELAISQQRATMEAGTFRMTFFGSLIKDNKEYHEGLNTPLTSDAIHEALHYDNPVVDQFDVAPKGQFAGTFNDEIFSGSMTGLKGSSIANSIVGQMRGIVGRTSEGTQGTTGSLQRTFRAVEKSQLYYDSLIPDPMTSYMKLGGAGILIKGGEKRGGFNTMMLATTGNLGDSHGGDYDDYVAWDFFPKAATPFASFAENGTPPVPIPRILMGKATRDSISAPFSELTGNVTWIPQRLWAIAITGSNLLRTTGGKGIPAMLTRGEYVQNCSPDIFARVMFGRGDGVGGSIFNPPLARLKTAANRSNFFDSSSMGPLRGYGYGLKGVLPGSPSIVLRRDKYGQMRDMLEQRKDSKFFNRDVDTGKIGDAPVSILFVDQNNNVVPAENTNSQNLSNFATASLPYSDGRAVDRIGSGENEVEIDID